MLFLEQKWTFISIGYSYADWAGCKLNREFTSGFVFTDAGGADALKFKKRSVKAAFMAEAKYMGLELLDFYFVLLVRKFALELGKQTEPQYYAATEKSRSYQSDPVTLAVTEQSTFGTVSIWSEIW